MTSPGGGRHPYGPAWHPGGVPPRPGHPPRGPRRARWEQLREGDWPPLWEVLKGVRLPGCIWVLFLVFIGPPLLLLLAYPLARTACRQSHRLFPVHAYPRVLDPFMARVQGARAWTALAASTVILAVYGTATDWAEIQERYFLRVAMTPWLLLLTGPLVALVVIRLAPPAARPGLRARLRPAGRAALWYFGAFTAVPLLFAAMVLLGESSGMAGPLVLLGPLLWTLFFVAFASLTLIPSVFGVSRVHAALPALITGVLVWELAAVSLAVGGLPPGPPLVQACALLGGPASVTAVACWEIARLRARYGVTLRV
ncbi:hypothetical protein ABZZ17_06405 [Streptomyces sp. NPDC006512]|uniref:hypothetical protein n=1 Tax=Streptomyces sp. NPDC006512 TaxID=3154307 RepID=UPI0033B4A2DF